MNLPDQPRAFFTKNGGLKELEATDATKLAGKFSDQKSLDILIACGQGVYDNGVYYGEFHDRDVYFEHAITTGQISSKFDYDLVVFSGGFTQRKVPWLSEAESFIRMIKDVGGTLSVPCVLDEAALDSADNLLLGLMTARWAIGDMPIRRVGIWAAWKFKKWRFNRNAEALGIADRVYFHGFSEAGESNIQVPESQAKKPTLDEYHHDEVELSLLRKPEYIRKRRRRWVNNRYDRDRDPDLAKLGTLSDLDHIQLWERCECKPMSEAGVRLASKYDRKFCSFYGNRFCHFENSKRFPRTLKCFDRIAEGETPQEADLPVAFGSEVIK